MDLKRFFQEINPKGWFLIILGTITWSLTMVKSGMVYDYGMGFWGPNGHDGVWHIAIINSLAKGTWDMPIFAGETIKNYHIGFDLLVAIIHKLTFIPVTNLYFQVIPPISAFLIGVFAYKFTYLWQKDSAKSYWATFFIYFSGSFGWVLTLLRNGKIGGESVFWSQQSVSTLINPPFALSLLFIFAGLHQLVLVIRTNSRKILMIATFMFGLLVQIKVYAGILILTGLFFAGFWRMLKRKGIALMKVFTGALVISILFFSPLSDDVGNTITFKPFWFVETMMQFSDRVGWQRYGEAMVNYKLAGNLLKGILAYIFALAIFWFGNLGTRIIKLPLFFKHLRNFKRLNYIDVFIYTIIGLGVILPTFFIQRGTPWNTIQFLYYSLVFSGVLAGVALAGWLKSISLRKYMSEKKYDILIYHSKKTLAILVIVSLTIPTTIGTLWYNYLPSRPPARISSEELEALEFLKNLPDGVVLTIPFDRQAADAAVDNPPRPLYLYESTAYVSAFSEKTVYLEDQVNLEITGYDWKQRRASVEDYLSHHTDVVFLKDREISYLYFVKPLNRYFIYAGAFTRIFTNDEVDIFVLNSHLR